MTCAERDQDLLLFAHDALSLGKRLQTLWHLRGCARCQARLSQFETVSRALAVTVGGHAAPGAFAQIPIVHGPRPGLPIAAIFVTAAVLCVLAGVAAMTIHPAQKIPTLHRHSAACKRAPLPPGCAPNLPNDHCR